MKSIISFLAVTFLFCNLLHAQTPASVTEMYKYIQNQEKLVDEAFSKKDYDEVIKVLNENLAYYKGLSSELSVYTKGIVQRDYYNLACAYSQKKDKEKAVTAFRNATLKGYIDYAHAKVDTDLDFIRNESAFQTLMDSIRNESDYIYVLQHSGKYNSDKNSQWPTFIYEDANTPGLIAVRKYFNLDSIAGPGDEISKIKRILLWVHNRVAWDGNFGYNGPKNAIDITKFFDKEKQGVNCRMMATLLCECYLSMGLKARFVTCMPKSENDPDCHVISTVFSKTLNKWLWVDPTFNAYVADEKGNLLSIEEVREKIIRKDSLVLNDDANENNKIKIVKSYYLDYYMAKNLYWINCAVFYGYNTESRKEGPGFKEYVLLMPEGFTVKRDYSGKETVVNNSGYFWQTPL